MGERNDDLAYQTLDKIREDPDSWDQLFYFCGSTACYAGWALYLDAANHGRKLNPMEIADPAVDAAELLGWSNSDAATVFQSATGDFAELERLVKNVLNGEVQECDRRVPNGTGWLHFNR